ncbi:MAG: hypothetical protein QMO91_05335 [Candidatus Tisiphia sp.]|nr:hypothetical protein [Candidatus Tisiphia sp.]
MLLPSDLVQVLEFPQNYSFLEVHAALSDPRNILKNDYLNKATNPDVPATYNDKVKFLLGALHMKGLGAKGDELHHISNITKILANGFNPEDLPKLYMDVIQKANDKERELIFKQCKDTTHAASIFVLLYPEFNTPETVTLYPDVNDAPENACSVTGGADISAISAENKLNEDEKWQILNSFVGNEDDKEELSQQLFPEDVKPSGDVPNASAYDY